MTEFTGLAHVGLFIKDVARSAAFYTDILGFEKIWENINPSPEGDVKVIFVRRGGLVIELVQFPAPERRADGFFDHVALAVTGLDDMIARLTQRGVDFETGSRTDAPHVFPKGSRWIMFRGPDGERLELNEIL